MAISILLLVPHVAQADPDGEAWAALGSGMDSTVYALAFDAAGNLYAGGDFTDAGGVADTKRIAQWDGSTWSPLGTGIGTSYVSSLAIDSAGDLYAGGGFTDAGGVADTKRIAQWDGSDWSALGTGMNKGTVYALAFDSAGNLYAGGSFTKAGGVANTAYIAKWDGSTWSPLGTGMGQYGNVYALAFDSAGNLYAGGYFDSAGGVAADHIAKWDGSVWSALGTGMNSDVNALAFDSAGNLYAGGSFSSAGGVAADGIAKWDGSAWSPLGSGILMVQEMFPGFVTTDSGTVRSLAFDGAGNLYAGGGFTNAGGMDADNIAIWDGSDWSPLDPGMNIDVRALTFDSTGTLFAGGYFTSAGGVAADYIAQWQPQLEGDDLPASYGDAQHVPSTTLVLGSDGEADDGAVFPTILPGGVYTAEVTVSNTCGKAAQLVGWVDFDADGDFTQAGDRSSPDLVGGSGDAGDGTFTTGNILDGTVDQTVTLQWTFTGDPPTSTYARVRLTTHSEFFSDSSPEPDGTYGSGETEGYGISGDPLAVTLGYFLAEANGETVDFVWQTTTENGVAGFLLYAGDGTTQLNDALIASLVIDSVTPTAYEFNAQTETTAFYLDEIGIDGFSQRHGPFGLSQVYGAYVDGSGEMQSIFLPVVVK